MLSSTVTLGLTVDKSQSAGITCQWNVRWGIVSIVVLYTVLLIVDVVVGVVVSVSHTRTVPCIFISTVLLRLAVIVISLPLSLLYSHCL